MATPSNYVIIMDRARGGKLSSHVPVPRPSSMRREGLVSDCMRMREHSAKSAESEYVRILWACTFTHNFTAKYTENLAAHAHAVDTRPSLRIIEGLGTKSRLGGKVLCLRARDPLT